MMLDSAYEPRLRLMTVAPLLAANMIPAAMSVELPDPVLCMTLMGMMRAFQLAPAMPISLLVTAAAIPATWVPCTLSSKGALSALMKSHPWTSSMYPLPSSSYPSIPFNSASFTHVFAAKSGCK